MDEQADLQFDTVPTTAVPIDNSPFANPITNDSYAQSSMFSFQYYRRFFDVTTEEVFSRIRAAIIPMERRFLHNIEKPDLYGPVWITATISFLTFAFGNISLWIRRGKDFTYSFGSLVFTYVVLNLWTFGGPFVIWYLDRAQGPAITSVMTLFGYSTLYIAASSLTTILLGVKFGFVLVLVAAGAGAFSILTKMQYHERSESWKLKGMTVSSIAAIVYFFIHLFVHFICFVWC